MAKQETLEKTANFVKDFLRPWENQFFLMDMHYIMMSHLVILQASKNIPNFLSKFKFSHAIRAFAPEPPYSRGIELLACVR